MYSNIKETTPSKPKWSEVFPGRPVDFRSDTVTQPTAPMKEAMFNAPLGDVVWGDDPTVLELEELAASITGKEAGLFVLSGTQGNQLAIMSTRHFLKEHAYYEVITDAEAHIYVEENAGLSIHSRCQVRPIFHDGHHLTKELIEPHLHTVQDYHRPPTGIICLENTLHGTVMPLEEIKRIKQLADSHNIKMHLDGARVWNASVEAGVDVKEYGQYFDTMSLCLSKGMGAPVGSILVGKKEVIEIARQGLKALGGGIRQGGLLAAAGIYAIKNNVERMKEDHSNAKYLEQELNRLGFEITRPVETNMVWFSTKKAGVNLESIRKKCEEQGVVFACMGDGYESRFVLHLEISRDRLKKALGILEKELSELK